MRACSVLLLLFVAASSLAAGSVAADDSARLPASPLLEGPVVFLPLVANRTTFGQPPILLSALYYDTCLTGEPDEAFQLFNATDAPVELTGWQVSDGTRSVVFPAGVSLPAKGTFWCARESTGFEQAFGELPACEYGPDTDPAVPNLGGDALRFANTGGKVILADPGGSESDALVYKAGAIPPGGWEGPPVFPYQGSSAFGVDGQILYRKLSQEAGLPGADTNRAADWASDMADIFDGRKAQFPGWDLDRFFLPTRVQEQAGLQVILAPDHAHAALAALLRGAQQEIRFEGHTFESASLADLLAERASAGVHVEMLLHGAPVGGVNDQQKWAIQRIAQAGGAVYYLRAPESGSCRRYSYQHGKFWVLDGALALVGSENPSPDSFPDDDKSDGTLGRRGVYLVTDAPSAVSRLTEVMDADIDPVNHGDVWAWDPADPALGAPPAGFTPSYASGGAAYPVLKSQPLVTSGVFTFEVLQSPEHALRTADSILRLIARAGPGDTLLVEQLYEHTYWGAEASNVWADPNPRLEAYIDAARRGARVRLLLDSFFDNQQLSSPRSNLRTVEYLQALAQAEGLDLQARRRNPTGGGLHNKMILAEIDGEGWVLVGSLNGGEVSAKLNREMSLLVGSRAAFDYLAEVFWYDWGP